MGHESSIAIKNLENVLRLHTNKSAVDQALLDYKAWVSKIKNIRPPVSHLVYLLKATEERSGDTSLKEHRKISSLILSHVDHIKLDISQRIKKENLSLLWYGIGKKYQLEMEFRDPEGSKVKILVPDLI